MARKKRMRIVFVIRRHEFGIIDRFSSHLLSSIVIGLNYTNLFSTFQFSKIPLIVALPSDYPQDLQTQ